MSIHDAIMNRVRDNLQTALIDNIAAGDPAIAGVVQLGPLQDDPDAARISITLHENDPDQFYGTSNFISGDWNDEVDEIECGAAITMRRRFTVKARCLLVNTQEDLAAARSIASAVRERIEQTLLTTSFTGVTSNGEYVSRGIFSDSIKGEQIQAGGPPDAFDFHIKIRFEVLTTKGVTL